jgi:hypothetical protein
MSKKHNAEDKEKALHIGSVSSRLISEAILNDKQLQALHAERAKIYSLAIPIVIMKENGEAETIWLDETNHPNLSKINQMIEHRTEQIKNFYS